MASKIPNSARALVVIVGQTASGKSALAMQLAQKYDGEIICADSRTIYKGMDIGTAKPSLKDQELVPHFGLDLVNPDERFSAGQFKQYAEEKIKEIQARGKLPIMVGGSGLYIDSVLFDYQFSEAGAERDQQNPRHLKKTNESAKQKEMRPDTLAIGIQVEKEVLYARIEQRVDAMLAAGLVNEVQNLLNAYGAGAPGMLAPAYRAFTNVQGLSSCDKAKEQFVRSHKQLAKRQMTWFKRNKSIHWITDVNQAEQLITKFLNKFATIEP